MNFVTYGVGTIAVTLPVPTYGTTEEEWNSAVTGDYLNNVRVDVEAWADDGETYVTSYQMSLCETAVSIMDWPEKFAVKRDGVWYEVYFDEELYEYVGVECAEEKVINNYYLKGVFGQQLADKYSLFTYDEENQCYAAKSFALEIGKIAEEVRVYIRNGRIVMIEQDITVTVENIEVWQSIRMNSSRMEASKKKVLIFLISR